MSGFPENAFIIGTIPEVASSGTSATWCYLIQRKLSLGNRPLSSSIVERIVERIV